MEIKSVDDDEQSFTMPKGEDESRLVQMLFEKVTELRPDWPMADRSDLAMAMLSVVKRWAHESNLDSGENEDGDYWALRFDQELELTEPIDE
jgi:hypothetical protein